MAQKKEKRSLRILNEKDILKTINSVLKREHIIHVKGKAGSGKTNLVLYLVYHLLGARHACAWIQASEHFPVKRLKQIEKSYNNKFSSLQERFFIFPARSLILSHEKQELLFQGLLEKYLPNIPSLKCLVVDSISYHLRLRLSMEEDMNIREVIVNDFFEKQLAPLLFYCSFKNILIFLIHEFSTNPTTSQDNVFYSSLFERIKGVTLELFPPTLMEAHSHGRLRRLIIHDNEKSLSLKFEITNHGITFYLP
ncbi:MAG: hypothetical protein ACTSXH_13115 [Promethearchaeota archaeon]